MPFDEQSRAEQNDGAAGDGSTAMSAGAPITGDLFNDMQVDDFYNSAHQIKSAAEDGQWAIDEEGMNAYLKVCNAFLDKYGEMVLKANFLGDRAKMGSSPYAYRVADFNVQVAVGDERSLIPNLELMRDGYKQLKEALDIARRNYDENEASQVQRLGKLMPE